MSGIDFIADTNLLIYLLEGKPNAQPFIGNIFAISFVSEIELLGWYRITDNQKKLITKLLDHCFIIELSDSIKAKAIELKQHSKIKLPDAIIAATSLQLDIPLVTADRGFEKIKNLNALIIS